LIQLPVDLNSPVVTICDPIGDTQT